MKHRIVLFIAALGAALGLTVSATSNATAQDLSFDHPRAELIVVLSHFHEAPDSAALAAFDDLVPGLIEVAGMSELNRLPRRRALSALAERGEPEVLEFLAGLASTETDEIVLEDVMITVGRLAVDNPEWALGIAEAHVGHRDFGVRERVVSILGQVRALPELRPSVDDALVQIVVGERNPEVKAALDRVLAIDPELRPGASGSVIRRAN